MELYKKIEIISSIFSHSLQYETRNQLQEEKWEKHKHGGTKQHSTKYIWVNEEIKEEIRKFLKTNENENTTFQKSVMQQKKF